MESVDKSCLTGMSKVCRTVEEVESSEDSLKSYHYNWPSENVIRHHVLESPQTQAKRRQDESLMCAIRPLQLERILEHSNHSTTRVICFDTLQVLIDLQLSI